MKVVLVIRNDALTKSAGDVDLAKQYGKLLANACNAQADVLRYMDVDVALYDLVVLFNIDMPMESYDLAKVCMVERVPYVVYTLHPKAECVNAFLRFGTRGAQWLAATAAGYDLIRYENIAYFVRMARRRLWNRLFRGRGTLGAAQFVLYNALRVLVSCESERRAVVCDFRVDAIRVIVVPHIISVHVASYDDGTASLQRSTFVLCAGRIEPRKNQIAVLEIARAHPELQFLVVGRVNRNHKAYVRAFRRRIDKLPNVEWRDHVPVQELVALMKQARAYISLSWFEVFSLIDLMANALGVPSVLSTGSYLFDELDDKPEIAGLRFVDARDRSGAAAALVSLPKTASVVRHLSGHEELASAAALAWRRVLQIVQEETVRHA